MMRKLFLYACLVLSALAVPAAAQPGDGNPCIGAAKADGLHIRCLTKSGYLRQPGDSLSTRAGSGGGTSMHAGRTEHP